MLKKVLGKMEEHGKLISGTSFSTSDNIRLTFVMQKIHILVRRPTSWPTVCKSCLLHMTETNSYNQKQTLWNLLLLLLTLWSILWA